jgi:putative hydrolase of the HAD superfamily
MSEVHTVFFDVGGTLLRPHPSAGAVYAEVAAHYGFQIEGDEVDRRAREFMAGKRWSGLTHPTHHTTSLEQAKNFWRVLVRHSFGPAADSPRFEACFQALFEEFSHAHRYALFPEVESVLQELESRGHRLGIISNWDARLRPLLIELQLDSRFSPIVISCETGFEKPDRRIFEAARRQSGAGERDKLVHVGDHPIEDVQAGRDAGFDARLVERDSGAGLESALADLLG